MRYFFPIGPAAAGLSQVGLSAGEPNPIENVTWIEAPGSAREYVIEMIEGVPTPVAIARDPADVLGRAREIRLAAVKARRDQAEWGGCETPSGRVDTDPDSQRKINGAVVMAQILGASFVQDWRMADNSVVPLDAPAMVAMGLAVGQHVSLCQARKNDLDAAIAAAATVEDIDAIEIDAGWPS